LATLLFSRRIRRQAFSHGLAAIAALAYAWFVSSTSYVTSAVQFVSPLAVIILTHILRRTVDGGYTAGFSRLVLSRSMLTAFILMVGIVLIALIAPMPADASSWGDTAGVIVGVIMCLAIVALIIFTIGFLIYWLFRGGAMLFKLGRKDKGPPNSKLNDLATLTIVLGSVFALSLEGVTQTLSFSASESAVSRHVVKADVARVWMAAATATSPDVPLPAMLRIIPQPVKILTDEGIDLGARRIVQIAGREGSGELSMRVIRRTNTDAEFEVLSDTSPVSMWIAARSLTFRVESIEGKTQLSVSSQYDRLLAPAWFFRPFMGVAAHFAVDTLAQDIMRRAETN
jgi:hypothetical protein